MEWFAKLRTTAAAIGTANTLLYVISRLFQAIFGHRVRLVKYYFTAQPVPSRTAGRSDRRSSFDLSWVDRTCYAFAQVDRPPEVIRLRFDSGARCLLATSRDGRIAGFLWITVGSYQEDEVRATFVPGPEGGAAWDFDVTVMPDYRMTRVFSDLWSRANEELRSCGVAVSLSRISAFNGGSLAAHRRLGATIVGSAIFVCVGHWQLMKSSIPPKWHLSWREDQRPVLAIDSGISQRAQSRQFIRQLPQEIR